MTHGTDLESAVHHSPLTGGDSWWSEEADVVEGYDFIKDAALFSLVGVPFRIFTLTFRAGIQQKGIPWRNDYVSAELRIAPEPVIHASWDRIQTRRADDMILDKRAIPAPGEQLGINSGSTGIYRQLVQYLEAKSLISFPEILEIDGKEYPLPATTGKKNECRYDLPMSAVTLATDVTNPEVSWDSEAKQVTAFHVALDCLRGLRFSHYDNEFTDADGALTWYIA